MSSVRKIAFGVGAGALIGMGIVALSPAVTAERIEAPMTPGEGPTTSMAPSASPANPVDCTDPNNAVTCPGSVDSPMVDGTAEPGSPYRD